VSATLTATNGDVRLAYDVRGEGDPLLLVQGLGYARWGWDPIVDLLAERFTVVQFDNRGIGASDVPRGPYSAEVMAQDAAAVLDAAGLERAHVVGASLGGIVAQQLALEAPERVDRLVLACTTPGTRGFAMPDRTVRLFVELPRLAPQEGLRRAIENALADETVERRPELVDDLLARRLADPPDLAGWRGQAAAGMSFDVLDRLGEIHAPTLVVHGTADNVVDYRNGELLAERIPGARLETFAGTGHLFFWEEPERFAQIVSSFLREPA
jgi:pimeloyl-ACP methyl ester carboxylesterase